MYYVGLFRTESNHIDGVEVIDGVVVKGDGDRSTIEVPSGKVERNDESNGRAHGEEPHAPLPGRSTDDRIPHVLCVLGLSVDR